MASDKGLLKNSVQEREYLEIDAKVKFHAVVSCIIKWQISSSEVPDEAYELNKEQYITEAESLQSMLAEAYLRLESSTVYKVSSSEEKKKEMLMEELSYEISYLSGIILMQTDCHPIATPPETTEQVDTDQLSTALQDIHVEPAITEIQNADEPCKGYSPADTVHTVIVTEEPDAHTEETEVHKKETAARTEENNAHKKETAAHIEETDVHKKETAARTEENDAHRKETVAHTEESDVHKETFAAYTEDTEDYKEHAAYTENTEQHPIAWSTVETSTSTNSHSTVMKTQGMIEKAYTESDIAVDTDNGTKVWNHPQNTEETIETPETIGQGIICCQFDYSNEICYLLLYS